MVAPREMMLTLDCDPRDLTVLADHALIRSPRETVRSLDLVGFDTDAGDLRAAGLSLQVGRDIGPEGEAGIQIVEADGGGPFARAMWECPVDELRPDLVALDLTPAGKVLAQAGAPPLSPRHAIAIERIRRSVRYGASSIDVTLDLGRIEATPLHASFCEAGFALSDGDPVDLLALVQALSETLPLHLAALTIGERGEALVRGSVDRPSKAHRVRLQSGAEAGEAFAMVAQDCLRHLRRNEASFVTTRDPEALHQIRVALRRLRAAFSLFRPLLTDDPTATLLREEIKRVTEPFGRARDLDVFLAETLAPEIERCPEKRELRDLRTVVDGERDRAYQAVLAILRSAAWRILIIDLVAWIGAGPWRQAARSAAWEQPARKFAAAELEHLRRRIKKRGRDLDRLAPGERHRVRIEAKKLRYGAEFFATLYIGNRKSRVRYKTFVSALTALQDHLGALNDIATIPAIMGRQPELEAIPFSADIVVENGAARTRSLLKAAARARETLLATRPFWR